MLKKILLLFLCAFMFLGCSEKDRNTTNNTFVVAGEEETPVDPFCTNKTVFLDHSESGGKVRLTSFGYYLELDEDGSQMFGNRWRIRNESNEDVVVTYDIVGTHIEGVFFLQVGKLVLFTSNFLETPEGGGTMRIFVDGRQVNVKAQSGAVKDLTECQAEAEEVQ